METTKYVVFNYKRITVNILFLLLFASIIIQINPDFPLFYNGILRFVTYIIISGAAVFYIHSLVLLPILEQESNKGKYKNYAFGIAIIYFLLLSIFWIANQGNLGDSIFVLRSDSLIESTLILFALSGFPLLISIFLSYAYGAIFLGKKVVLQFLEFFVNLIIMGLLCTIFIPDGKINALITLITIFTIFYTGAFYTTPLMLKKQQRKIFWLSIFVMSTIYILVMYNVFASHRTPEMIFIFFGILCLVHMLSFIYGHIRIKIIAREKIFTLKLGAKDSELKLLKSQVNPHFLFNTLNTLYATALEEKASKTAESTAKLANLIRYMQEDINKDFIPLENEIKYLKDYINIQNLRCAIQPKVETKFVNIGNHKISPGLLIPFVENAFKYGIDPSKPSNLIVTVNCTDHEIQFYCENTFDENYKTYEKEQGFGIGIKNAKQRLELIYPKKHTFEIVKEKNVFSVKIIIITK